MLRRLTVPIASVTLLGLLAGSLPVCAEDLPIIFTYEQRKQRLEARSAARDPKRFWIRQVFNSIERKMAQLPKALPSAATVRLSFSVSHDGRLLTKVVTTSSGNADADKAAMTMVERASPFPPMPEAMNDAEMTFALPVRFR